MVMSDGSQVRRTSTRRSVPSAIAATSAGPVRGWARPVWAPGRASALDAVVATRTSLRPAAVSGAAHGRYRLLAIGGNRCGAGNERDSPTGRRHASVETSAPARQRSLGASQRRHSAPPLQCGARRPCSRRQERPISTAPDAHAVPVSGMAQIRAVLRIRPFRRLWLVLGLSSLGDWLGLLATVLFASAQVTGSAQQGLAFGGVVVMRLLPAMLLGPLAGAFADRFDRRFTMAVCDLLRFLLFASIPLAGVFLSPG